MGSENSLGYKTDTQVERPVNRERLPWCDITDAEKVERLRVILKRTQDAMGRMEERLYETEQITNKHQHGPDGSVLIRAGRGVGRLTCGAEQCQPGKEWF